MNESAPNPKVVQRCWPWSHEWSRWEDVREISRSFKGVVFRIGIEQERRCKKCNKLQLHAVWPKE